MIPFLEEIARSGCKVTLLVHYFVENLDFCYKNCLQKRTRIDVWHICVNCTAWPTRSYTEKWVDLTNVDPSTSCIQYLQRRQEGKCRMCGPRAMYELESRRTKIPHLNLVVAAALAWKAFAN